MGEIELRVCGIQGHEEIEDFVDGAIRGPHRHGRFY